MALRVRQYPEVDAAYAIIQIEGWQKARTKLPELAATEGWKWGRRLNMEQCSSQDAAQLKCQLAGPYKTGVDLTGGAGIDSYYLSAQAEQWHYVEREEALCEIARHNFGLTNRRVEVHHDTAEHFAETMPAVDLIYLDPARRDEHGGKVFRIADCSPNLLTLFPTLRNRCHTLMVKFSPMLDIHEALRELGAVKEVYTIAIKNEVKELLFVLSCQPSEVTAEGTTEVHTPDYPIDSVVFTAINLRGDETERFSFRLHDEAAAEIRYLKGKDEIGAYIYEPNAAILKAGAFKLVGQRYGLKKLSANTHLYCSDGLVEHFPGRVWRITAFVDKKNQKTLVGQHANILTRNYPLKPEEIRKKLRLQDGGEQYFIGGRAGNDPVLIQASRIQ